MNRGRGYPAGPWAAEPRRRARGADGRPGAGTADPAPEPPAAVAEPGSRPAAGRSPPHGGGAARPVRRREIARLLGRPEPTPEQVAVIEAPVEPLLVVAGAGSGKTETMASRVVWLVANGLVAPGAGARADLHPQGRRRAGATGSGPGCGPCTGGCGPRATLADDRRHGVDLPLLRRRRAHRPRPADRRRAGRPAAHRGRRLAARSTELVEHWDGDLGDVETARRHRHRRRARRWPASAPSTWWTPTTSTACVGRRCSTGSAQLPARAGERAPGVPGARCKDVVARLRRLPGTGAPRRASTPGASETCDAIDFGDQVALAARLARGVPRGRGRASGTGTGSCCSTSTRTPATPSSCCCGRCSAAGTRSPPSATRTSRSTGGAAPPPATCTAFPATSRPRRTAPRRPRIRYLSTSWRNDAGDPRGRQPGLGRPLRAPEQASVGRRRGADGVPPLRGRPGRRPGGGHALRWLAHGRRRGRRGGRRGGATLARRQRRRHAGGESPTAAVLCRTRAQFPLVEAALRARGLPVEVVGLGGLLHVPGGGGPAGRPGGAARPDARRLADAAAHRARRGGSGRATSTRSARGRPSCSGGPGRPDAADPRRRSSRRTTLARRGHRRPAAARLARARGRPALSDEGPPAAATGSAGTLRDAARRVRARPAAGPRRRGRAGHAARRRGRRRAPAGGRRRARAHLDAFVDVAAGLLRDGRRRPRSRAFLGWLAAADERGARSRRAGRPGPPAGRACRCSRCTRPRAWSGTWWPSPVCVEGTFPSGHSGSLAAELDRLAGRRFGALPFPLRGDADGLPHWRAEAARAAADARQGPSRRSRPTARASTRSAEERRLAYVALDPRRATVLRSPARCGATAARPREPSRFLNEVAELRAGERAVRVRGRDLGRPAGGRGGRTRARADPSGPVARRPARGRPGRGRRGRGHGPRPPRRRCAARGSRRSGRESAEPEREPTRARRGRARSRSRGRRLGPGGGPAARGAGGRPSRCRARSSCPRTCPRRRSSRSPPTRTAFADRTCAGRCRSRRSRRRGAAARSTPGWSGASARPALVDLDELPGAADDADADADDGTGPLQRTIPGQPRGRPDARGGRGRRRDSGRRARAAGPDRRGVPHATDSGPWDVVDWKTGPPARGEAEAAARAVQLAVYRLAWARLQGVPVEQVGAAFFHAATGQTVRPVELLDEVALAALIAARVQ